MRFLFKLENGTKGFAKEDEYQSRGFLSLTLKANKPSLGNDDWNVLDWEAVADLIKEHKPSKVVAGMPEGWELTAATIYENGEPKNPETPMMTSWGTFAVELDGKDAWLCYKRVNAPDSEDYKAWSQKALDKLKTA